MANVPVASDEYTRIRGAESRVEFAMAGAFTLLLAGTLAYVHSLFAPITPPVRLYAWTAFTAAVIAVMGAGSLLMLKRRPSDLAIVQVWSPAGKIVAVLFDLAAASSVWLLLPYASEPLRMLMVVFYAAVISGQVISTAESLGTIAFGVVSVFGSAAAFFFTTPTPYSTPLAIFLLAFGAMMIAVAATLKTAIRSAIRARLRAEATSSELAQALDAATEARNSKTRFIAAATHDLRQPLQAAALFFNQHVEAAEPARRAAAASGARLAFKEADALLDRLLEHLRLDTGSVQAKLSPESVQAIVSRVVEEVAPIAAASGMTIRNVSTTLHALCDAAMTARVLRNLVHNAVRHSRGRRVLVGAHRVETVVRVYVVDDGRGIADFDAPRFFAEFQHGGVGDTASAGMGLGLTSARRMAELMDGSVELDQRWRGGAAFYLELPLAPSPTSRRNVGNSHRSDHSSAL